MLSFPAGLFGSAKGSRSILTPHPPPLRYAEGEQEGYEKQFPADFHKIFDPLIRSWEGLMKTLS